MEMKMLILLAIYLPKVANSFDTETSCYTVDGPDIGSPCIFPFIDSFIDNEDNEINSAYLSSWLLTEPTNSPGSHASELKAG